jgi:protoporphyrinogen oxidase
LPANIKKDMKLKGFEACKMMLPFTRYVNERQDIGMGEWMKHHLSAEDYEYYTNSK